MSPIRTIGATLAALASGVATAVAADFPPYGPPPPTIGYYAPPAGFSWTGPYLGVMGGYGFGGSTIANDGWIIGAYTGANYQMTSSLVFGVEGDFTLTGKDGTSATTTVSNPWNATLRGRLGYAMDRLMVYGTAGLAVGRINVDDTAGPTSETATRYGWTAGAGIEAALSDHVIGRAEYRYTDLGSSVFTPGTISYTSSDVMGGIAFKF